ncbi:BrnT family toxin [Lysobacter sp. D1-1-M9]|uniref:BrnT family toxin n=1 Tax=Novilysobacter longmucuonensis TaxID=3098603 RepID=UPI002FCC2095
MDVHFELDGNAFVWNRLKARENLRKHGVRFEEAAAVFFDPLYVLVDASRMDEARDAAIGFARSGRLLYVVHLEIEDERVRLVSARRASPAEESTYAHR